jgi:hypothetical protein
MDMASYTLYLLISAHILRQVNAKIAGIYYLLYFVCESFGPYALVDVLIGDISDDLLSMLFARRHDGFVSKMRMVFWKESRRRDR